MDAKMRQFMDTVTARAQEARRSVQSAAGEALERVDEVKSNLEIAHLRSEQEKVFARIGHLVYRLSTEDDVTGPDGKTPRQALDDLLVEAEQFQQEIDNIARKAAKETT